MTRQLAGQLQRWSRSLPLRVRLVAGFAVAVTVVLTLAGSFVYWRVEYALDQRLDSDLRGDASALTSALSSTWGADTAGLDRTAAARRYQLLDASGAIVAAGSEVRDRSLLSRAQFRRAEHGPLLADIGALLPITARPLRVLAQPLPGGGRVRVLVVADRRDQRDEALRELVAQLLAAGVATLAVTAVVGERLAHAALRPVERYRTRAAAIALGATGMRLDVPTERDDEVTRLGHTLNDVLAALEHAMDRERQFTQDASHELRTPLTLLSSRIQLALRRTRTTAEHETVLRELQHDVGSLIALAEHLLALSTVGAASADTPGTPATADLLAAVTTAVPEHRHDDDDDVPSLLIDPAVEQGPLPVRLSEPQLGQILGNLLGNARLHGEGAVRVELRVAVPAAHRHPRADSTASRSASLCRVAVLAVHDDGAGIDAEFLPTAADRFARSPLARSRPGAGLGLSLVSSLADSAGGELRLCSNGRHQRYSNRIQQPCTHPASGTTATVLLPVEEPNRPS